MYIIGIIGASGSGKSIASDYLKSSILGSVAIHVDEIYIDCIYNERERFEKKYQRKLFDETGWFIGIDYIFNNPERKAYVRSIIDPIAVKKVREQIKVLSEIYCCVILDFIFLDDIDLWNDCNKTILMDTPKEARRERLVNRPINSCSEKVADARDLSMAQYKCKTDFKIRNSGNLDDLKYEVVEIANQLQPNIYRNYRCQQKPKQKVYTHPKVVIV